MTANPFADYATTAEVAAALGIHEESARRLIRQGDIPATRLGKFHMVKRDDLERYAKTYDSSARSPAARRKVERRRKLGEAIAAIRASQ